VFFRPFKVNVEIYFGGISHSLNLPPQAAAFVNPLIKLDSSCLPVGSDFLFGDLLSLWDSLPGT